jgi:DNA-binding NarL/FixJ family response regulator
MSKSVLIMDDNSTIRKLIRRYLETRGKVEVCGEASNSVEGVEKALELSPDLIVMDFSMPRMNGLQAAREVKRKMPAVPIVLFTSHESELCIADAKEAGISAIISKDQAEKLVPAVLTLLGLLSIATPAA